MCKCLVIINITLLPASINHLNHGANLLQLGLSNEGV